MHFISSFGRNLAVFFCAFQLCLCSGCTTQPGKASPAYTAPSSEDPIPPGEESFGPATGTPAPASETASGHAEGNASALLPCWQDLRSRLAADGLSGERVDALLATLGPLTQSPMGRKMKALYKKTFFPTPPPAHPQPAPTYYKGVVTQANAQKCRDFIARNQAAFSSAEKIYGVPSSVAVSLLFVETRLGTVLGDVKENAFQTLASMAESRNVRDIPDWLHEMPGYEQHMDWFSQTMPKRADWAYKETRALVKYMLQSGLTPDRFPGSIYGAIGLCQFMPSNLPTYGADGNGDGVVDLFQVPDAVMSLSNYLSKHGWKPGVTRDKQYKCLLAYNHAAIYANTILALSDLVSGKTAQKPSM